MPEQEVKSTFSENVQQQLLYTTRSEDVQEIMGRMPSWIIRRGITLMAVLILVLIIGAYLFKYPDVIPAQVFISSGTPPVKLFARNNLPIQKLFVQNNQEVKAGQVLCVLYNSANFQDIEAATALAQKLDTCFDLNACLEDMALPRKPLLGDLQPGYIVLLQAVTDYQFFVTHNSYGTQIRHLQTQSLYQDQLTDQLAKRGEKMKSQLTIQQNRFSLDSSLVAATIMSKVEYENALRDLMGSQMNNQDNYSAILQSRLQEKQITANISAARIQWQIEKNDLEQNIREAARQFNSQVAQWEQNYVLRSPVNGKVTFFRYWKENQVVRAGEAVLVVTPPIQQFIARGEIGLAGAGKIKKGQKVLIKLFAYPYAEFGSIVGKVESRSPVPLDSTFAIAIHLTNGLRTNAGNEITVQAQLQGTAEILTDNKSLLARLFENVYGKNRK